MQFVESNPISPLKFVYPNRQVGNWIGMAGGLGVGIVGFYIYSARQSGMGAVQRRREEFNLQNDTLNSLIKLRERYTGYKLAAFSGALFIATRL